MSRNTQPIVKTDDASQTDFAEQSLNLHLGDYAVWIIENEHDARHGFAALIGDAQLLQQYVFIVQAKQSSIIKPEYANCFKEFSYGIEWSILKDSSDSFDIEQVCPGLREVRERILGKQFSGLRILFDMSSLASRFRMSGLVALSTQIQDFLKEGQVSLVSFFDRLNTSPTELLNMMPLFPRIMLGDKVVDNRYYYSTSCSHDPNRHRAMFDDLMEELSFRVTADERYAKILKSSNTLLMLETIIDSMGDGVLVTDETGQLLLMNKMAESIIGYGFTDMPVKDRVRKFGNYLPDKVTPYPMEELPTIRALRGENSDQVEIFMKNDRRPQGFWVSTTARPLRSREGRILGGVMVFRDISARRTAEEENVKLKARITQAQKLESLGLLAGGIAHDFNNLLMGVLGNAGLALIELAPEGPVQERIEQIRTSATRLAELTNQLLAYSGQGSFIEEPVNLSNLVSEMEQLLRTVVSKKARVLCSFEPALPTIYADATQLRQITMNLITNASDALRGQPGTVTVRTGTMFADRGYLAHTYLSENLAEGYYVFLEVTDTGCGMNEKTQLRIFDPFFTTKVKGRGLGLAAVLGLVRRHGGALNLSSVVGKGTTFRVMFPVPHESEKGEIKDAQLKIGENKYFSVKGTILVIDDELIVRDVSKDMLEYAGLKVLTARNGNEGIELFKQHCQTIDAVILDMTMPDMSGEEVYRELKLLSKDLPIIISSGYSEGDAAGRLRRQGIAGYLQKPYVPETLLQLVQKSLIKEKLPTIE